MMRLTLDVNIQVVMAMEGPDSFFSSMSLVEDIPLRVLRRPFCLPQSPPSTDVLVLAALPEAR